MSQPKKFCITCGRERECGYHMRAEFPPDAAEKWLKKTCQHKKGKKGKPCNIEYRAGIQPGSNFVGQGSL